MAENQLGFMPGRSTTEAIYLTQMLIEKYKSKERDLDMDFVEDFGEKRHVLGLYMSYTRHERITTSVRTPRGETKNFPIGIGLHQGSALSLYLFNIVVDLLIKDIQKIIHNCIFFMAVFNEESREADTNTNKLELWRGRLWKQRVFS